LINKLFIHFLFITAVPAPEDRARREEGLGAVYGAELGLGAKPPEAGV